MGTIRKIINGIKSFLWEPKSVKPMASEIIPKAPKPAELKPIPVQPKPVHEDRTDDLISAVSGGRDKPKAKPIIKKPVKALKPRKKRKPRKTAKKQIKVSAKEIVQYRKTIRKLRKEIEDLKKQIEKQKIEPKEALSGVQVIYKGLQSERHTVDNEIKHTKSVMGMLEQDYLKRRLSEEMFRKKIFDYREKLHVLGLEKKELSRQKKKLTTTTKQIPQIVPVTLEKISKTDNLETLLIKQQKTLEKLAEQRPIVVEGKIISEASAPTTLKKVIVGKTKSVPVSKIAAPEIKETKPPAVSKPPAIPVQKSILKPISGQKAPVSKPSTPKEEVKFVKKAFEAAPDSKKINAFLEEKAKGKINEQKLMGLEEKVNILMKKYNISENEIEQKLRNTGTENLVESVNKLVGLLELERKTKATVKKTEKIETAMRFTKPMKQAEEVKGIATEIKKQRIITDFDKILTYIAKEGKIRMGKISKELDIPRARAEDCCNLLEKEKQIEINYPPIGDAFVMTLDFKEREALEKQIKKNKKKVKK